MNECVGRSNVEFTFPSPVPASNSLLLGRLPTNSLLLSLNRPTAGAVLIAWCQSQRKEGGGRKCTTRVYFLFVCQVGKLTKWPPRHRLQKRRGAQWHGQWPMCKQLPDDCLCSLSSLSFLPLTASTVSSPQSKQWQAMANGIG